MEKFYQIVSRNLNPVLVFIFIVFPFAKLKAQDVKLNDPLGHTSRINKIDIMVKNSW